MARKPLSILIPLHDFALGGTERIAVRLAGAWAPAGADVTLFCTRAEGPLLPLLDTRVRVIACGKGGRTPIGRRLFARAVRRHVDDARPGIVFVPGNFHWPVARALIGAASPVVAQVSASLDKPQRGPLRQASFEQVTRTRLAGVAAMVTLSDRARDQIARIIGRDVAHTIPLPALEDDAPPPLPVPAGPPLIVAAGRLVPEKGFATLIEAFALAAHPEARLRIVGAGPDEARLRGLIDDLNVGERVALSGYAPDIRPDLDAARLFVLSSQFEGFPAVLVEALSRGRPVIATDCTPATALLSGDAGAVVPIGDAAAMAKAITAMLAAPAPDPEKLAARVAGHRIGAVARAYLDLFESVAR